VACDDRQKSCVAGASPLEEAPPRQLADELQPRAERVAQQHGAAELQCPAATTEVLRAETIEEATTTGWSEAPHHAAYNMAVSGCGKRTAYLVTCDAWEKGCVVGTPQKAEEGSPPQLADKLQPDAIRVAQQHGAAEFGCPAATAQVLRQETIQEPQTTGWYEPPHRAVYSIAVSGCDKRSTYVVACNDEKKGCTIGALRSAALE